MQLLKFAIKHGASPSSPLAVLIHGRAGDITVMNTFKRCIPEDWSIISLEAPYQDPIGGYSWWRIGSTDSPDDAASLLLSSLNQIISTERLVPIKTVALGFSQGAALLSILLQRDPAQFNAVSLLAGFVIKREIATGAKPNVLIVHGSLDETVPLQKAEEGYQYLKTNGYNAEIHIDPVGHKIGSAGMRKIKEWIVSSYALELY